MQGADRGYARLTKDQNPAFSRNGERSGCAPSRKARFPLLGGLRSLFEVLASVQHSRCAWSDLGDRARGSDRTRAGAGRGHCEGLGGSAEERICARLRSQTSLSLSAEETKAKKTKMHEKLSPVSVALDSLMQPQVRLRCQVCTGVRDRAFTAICQLARETKSLTDARFSTRDRVRRDSGADDRCGFAGPARARQRTVGANVWPPSEITHFDTPRRLAVIASGIPAAQPDVTEQMNGPPVSVAYKDGQPTPAAHAFAKKAGVDVSHWRRSRLRRANIWLRRVHEKGRIRAEILAENLPKEISSIYWPKNMYWRKANERFVRPVRWLVAMLDDEAIPLEFGGIAQGSFARTQDSYPTAPS